MLVMCYLIIIIVKRWLSTGLMSCSRSDVKCNIMPIYVT